MLAFARIDFHLHALDVGAMLRIDTRYSRVDKYATVSFRFSLKFEAQNEIRIRFLGG